MCTCSLPTGDTTGLESGKPWHSHRGVLMNTERNTVGGGKKYIKMQIKKAIVHHTQDAFSFQFEKNGTCKPSQANGIWCLICFLWCHGCQAVICAHHMSVISRRLHTDFLPKHPSSDKSAKETHSVSINLRHTDRPENHWNNWIRLICISLKRIFRLILIWKWNSSIKKWTKEVYRPT